MFFLLLFGIDPGEKSFKYNRDDNEEKEQNQFLLSIHTYSVAYLLSSCEENIFLEKLFIYVLIGDTLVSKDFF